MSDDLISRSALKEILDEQMNFEENCRDSVFDIIDNVQAVPLPDFEDGYKKAILDGKTNFSIPQGEWLKGQEISRAMIGDKVLHIDYKDYTCSNCGLILDNLLCGYDGSPFYKFCPNCGAEMRKETEND